MASFTKQIEQENADLAQIQKVARITGQKMFWQWVEVVKWFVFGILVAAILNIIMGQFVPEKPLKIDNKQMQGLVFECVDKRKKI